MSIGKGSGRVSKNGPGEYRETSRIRASTGEGSGRVPKNPKKLAKHNNKKKEGVCPSTNMRTPLHDSNKQEIKHLNHERQRGMPQCDV